MQQLLLDDSGERAPERLRQKALDTIDALLSALDEIGVGNRDAIHDARRRLKELRALTRLLGRGKAEAKFFRDAGRRLSGARDAKAALEAFDRLRKRFASEWKPKQFAKIRRALASGADSRVERETLDSLRSALRVERGQVAAWLVEELHGEDLHKALVKSYRRARRGMRHAFEQRTFETIHEWRMRVKMHWYDTQFLSDVQRIPAGSRLDALRNLSRRLGHHHDLVLIDEICRRSPEIIGSDRYIRQFRTFVARGLTELFAIAEEEGSDLFREPARKWGASTQQLRQRVGPKKSPPRPEVRRALLA